MWLKPCGNTGSTPRARHLSWDRAFLWPRICFTSVCWFLILWKSQHRWKDDSSRARNCRWFLRTWWGRSGSGPRTQIRWQRYCFSAACWQIERLPYLCNQVIFTACTNTHWKWRQGDFPSALCLYATAKCQILGVCERFTWDGGESVVMAALVVISRISRFLHLMLEADGQTGWNIVIIENNITLVTLSLGWIDHSDFCKSITITF